MQKQEGMHLTDIVLDRAKEPLKRFILRNRHLTSDEKVEAYGMLLDCVIEVIKHQNNKALKDVKTIIAKVD